MRDDQHWSVLDEVATERERQITREGFTVSHDDQHTVNELAHAGAAYAMADEPFPSEAVWPWDSAYWKPKDQRRNLIRAAALIVAAIERLDREPPRG